MASVVDICNKALDKLGHKPIMSLDDGTKGASLCKRNWSFIRDEVLRDGAWNFATVRKTTAPDTETPSWGFSYQHSLPTNCLKLIQVLDLSVNEFRVEGRKILANDDVLYIRYIKSETDPNQYDSMFINAVSTRLAIELCESLTQSTTKRQELSADYDRFITSTRLQDALENPPDDFEDDTWLASRY